MLSFLVTSTFQAKNVLRSDPAAQRSLYSFRNRQNPRTRLRRFVTNCTKPSSQTNARPQALKNAPPKVEVLPLEVVQRIAAGEVITGYDSVVQELVENSIDADANVIKVYIDLTTRSITVQDDGRGISREGGLADIARCNATSKLRTISELSKGVKTLGFRGQGLWAIAATAARLEVCSRVSDSLCGERILFRSDGNPQEDSISPVAMSLGTIAKVTGLPWTTEAVEARKVMKRCKDRLLRIALCHPNLQFHLYRNGKEVWRTVANSASADHGRIRVLAHELRLHPDDFRTASMAITGLCEMSIIVGIPSTVHSSSKSWMMIGVNGRCVGIRSVRRVISSTVEVPKGRYPVAFLNITMKAGLVNWNVSPMKTSIKFHSVAAEEKLVSKVRGLLHDSLHGRLITGVNELEEDATISLAGDTGWQRGMRRVMSLLSEKMSLTSEPDVGRTNTGTERENENAVLPISMMNARIVAQLLNTYILIEHQGGIVLVEQHVADERILYERLLESWKKSRFVPLKEPLKLPRHMQTEWLFTLTTLGLLYDDCADDNDNDGFQIAAVPEALASIGASNLRSLLLEVCKDGSTIEKASASVACRLAVKNGTALKMRQMESIVRELVRCDNPFTCPHGRPIFMELQTKELARLFRRSWLPERTDSRNDSSSAVRRKQGLLNERSI